MLDVALGDQHHVGHVGLDVLCVREGPGDQAVHRPGQAEAGERLADLVLGEVVEQFVVRRRAVAGAEGGDAGRGLHVVLGPRLDRMQRGERLPDPARARLDVGGHVVQERVHVGGAL